MVRLSVNINKVALIRNARGHNVPNVLDIAQLCEKSGAQGITVHPRPDERHIKFSDLAPLKELVTTEFNIEGYPSSHFIEEVLAIQPHQVTLVPDPPEALTSSFGWDTVAQQKFLKPIIQSLKQAGIRVSIFLNPDTSLIASAKSTGADRIELYTEPYAEAFAKYQAEPSNSTVALSLRQVLAKYQETARLAHEANLGVNAGHDLNLHNLPTLVTHVPEIEEVSIGQALVADALYYGLPATIAMYLQALAEPFKPLA